MIEEVVHNINKAIRLRSDELCKENDPLLYGLASPILIRSMDENEDQVVIPAIIDNDGECQYPFADDDFSFGVYHKLLNRNYTQAKKESFGDGNIDIAIDEVLLLCWGFRDQLRMNAIQFERQVITPCLPSSAMLVQTNFDQFSVFSGEFKNVVYNLTPELFLFSVKYKVQYIFNRECVEINEENKCQ